VIYKRIRIQTSTKLSFILWNGFILVMFGYIVQGYSKCLSGVYQLVINNTFEIVVYVFLFNRTTLQVFVTYLTGAL